MHSKIKLNNFESFVDMNIAADMHYTKLSKGNYNFQSCSYILDNVQVYDFSTNSLVLLQGAMDKDTYAFSFIRDFSLLKSWRGMSIEDNTVLVFHPGDELLSVSTMSFYGIIFKKEFFISLLERLCLSELLYQINEIDTFRLPPHMYNNLVKIFQSMFFLLNSVPNIDTTSLIRYKLEVQIPSLILDALLYSKDHALIPSDSLSKVSLDRALELVNSSRYQSWNVQELCQGLEIPERTLRYIFNQKLQITPHEFLKATRLNAVYNHLKNTNSKPIIKDLAQQYGFNHPGQFSKDFYNFFHKHPSELI